VKKVRVAESRLSNASLEFLASNVGAIWEFVTGEVLRESPGHLFAWDFALIGTSRQDFRLSIRTFVANLEGQDDDYGVLEVEPGAGGGEELTRAGNTFLGYQGEVVTEIFVIRETIQHRVLGSVDWELRSDFGLVFKLTRGVFALYMAGHQSDAIEIAYADEVASIEIRGRESSWEFDKEVGEDVTFEHDLVPLMRLLDERRDRT
jgi:hypothetical protein